MDIEEKLLKEDRLYFRAYPNFDIVNDMRKLLKEGTPPNEYGKMLLNKRGNHKKKH